MPARRKIGLEVVYCDEYLGYTLEAWLREVKSLVEGEYCVELLVTSSRSCTDINLVGLKVGEHIVLEGLPGEEGYLIEVLKKVLEALRVERCVA